MGQPAVSGSIDAAGRALRRRRRRRAAPLSVQRGRVPMAVPLAGGAGLERVERRVGETRSPERDGGLDEIGQHPGVHAEPSPSTRPGPECPPRRSWPRRARGWSGRSGRSTRRLRSPRSAAASSVLCIVSRRCSALACHASSSGCRYDLPHLGGGTDRRSDLVTLDQVVVGCAEPPDGRLRHRQAEQDRIEIPQCTRPSGRRRRHARGAGSATPSPTGPCRRSRPAGTGPGARRPGSRAPGARRRPGGGAGPRSRTRRSPAPRRPTGADRPRRAPRSGPAGPRWPTRSRREWCR